MNQNALKAQLIKNDFTYESIAEELGISKNTFWKKITGQTDFKLPEIQKLKSVLNLSEKDFNEIFFNPEVESQETF